MPESSQYKGINQYKVDLKIYDRAAGYELPVRFPANAYDEDGKIKMGYNTWIMEMTEDDFNKFLDWSYRNGGTIKILGVTDLVISTEPPPPDEDEPYASDVDMPMWEDPSSEEEREYNL